MSCQQMSRFLTTTTECIASDKTRLTNITPEDPYIFTDYIPSEPPILFNAQKSRNRLVDIQLSNQNNEDNCNRIIKSKKIPLSQLNENAATVKTPASLMQCYSSGNCNETQQLSSTAKEIITTSAGASTTITSSSTLLNTKAAIVQLIRTASPIPVAKLQLNQTTVQAQKQWNSKYDDSPQSSIIDDGENEEFVDKQQTFVCNEQTHKTDEDVEAEDEEDELNVIFNADVNAVYEENDDITSSIQPSNTILQHTPSLWQTPLLLDTTTNGAVVSPPTSPASLPSPNSNSNSGGSLSFPQSGQNAVDNTELSDETNDCDLPVLQTARPLPPSKFHNTTLAQHLKKVQCIKKSPIKSPKNGETVSKSTAAYKNDGTVDGISIGTVVNIQAEGVENVDVMRTVWTLPTPSPPLLPQLEPLKSDKQSDNQQQKSQQPQPQQQQQHSNVSDLNDIPVNVIFRKPQTTNEITRQLLAANDDCTATTADTTRVECSVSGVNGSPIVVPTTNIDVMNKLKNVKIIAPSIQTNITNIATINTNTNLISVPPKLQPLRRAGPIRNVENKQQNGLQTDLVPMLTLLNKNNDASISTATPIATNSIPFNNQQPIIMSSKVMTKRKNGITLTNNNLSNTSPANVMKDSKVSTTPANVNPTKKTPRGKRKTTIENKQNEQKDINAMDKLMNQQAIVKQDINKFLVNSDVVPIKTMQETITPSPLSPMNRNNALPLMPIRGIGNPNAFPNAVGVVKLSTNPPSEFTNESPSSSSIENALPYCLQQNWLRNSFVRISTNSREDRIAMHKGELQRQAYQLLTTKALQKVPIKAAKYRLICVKNLLNKYSDHNPNEFIPMKKCSAVDCMNVAIINTSYCSEHIVFNDKLQFLFQQCSWKRSEENIQCRLPVFDVKHDQPLCAQHGREFDEFKKKQQSAVDITSYPPFSQSYCKGGSSNKLSSNSITTYGNNISAAATVAARKRKTNATGTGNPVGRPQKRTKKLHTTIINKSSNNNNNSNNNNKVIMNPVASTLRDKTQSPCISNINNLDSYASSDQLYVSNSSQQQQQQQHRQQQAQRQQQSLSYTTNNTLLSPPALAPLSGLGNSIGRITGLLNTDTANNGLLSTEQFKDEDIHQIVAQFAMADSNTQNNNNNMNNCINNENHNNSNCNSNSNSNESIIDGTNLDATFMNSNSNSNFTSVFGSSSSIPSNDDFLSQDMLICDNSSAYASSEDTGFGGLSENELKGGGCGGSNDADDITLLGEQDLVNVFNSLPSDMFINHLFNAVRADECDEAERALEVVDILGDFLSGNDQILADADMEIVSSVMRSADCIDTAGLFFDGLTQNTNTSQSSMNATATTPATLPTSTTMASSSTTSTVTTDIRGLVQT